MSWRMNKSEAVCWWDICSIYIYIYIYIGTTSNIHVLYLHVVRLWLAYHCLVKMLLADWFILVTKLCGLPFPFELYMIFLCWVPKFWVVNLVDSSKNLNPFSVDLGWESFESSAAAHYIHSAPLDIYISILMGWHLWCADVTKLELSPCNIVMNFWKWKSSQCGSTIGI